MIAQFDLSNPNNEVIKQKFPISHSAYQKHETCGFQYDLYYNKRIEKQFVSSTMLAGKVFDAVFNKYMESMWYQNNFNLPQYFEQMWQEKFISKPRESKTDDLETYETLKHVCKSIPNSFNASGLIPLSTVDKKPCIQHKHTFDIGYGVLVRVIIDFIAWSKILKKPVVIDVKCSAPSALAKSGFASISEQLLVYSLACEADPRLEFNKFDYGAFWQAERKKMPALKKDLSLRKGATYPKIILPETERFNEFHKQQMPHRYIQKQIDINQGRFFAGSRMSFNSPCGMCDYSGLCMNGDKTGLVIRENYQPRKQNVA